METTDTSSQLSKQEQRTIHVMQLLGDKTRYKMFKLLLNGDEMCVSEIADKLNISVSAVSQHFRNFEMIGLVEKERMGQKICYALKEDDEIVKTIASIAK
jgi:DNA-binding transcriptional ArsR family regulator